MLVETDDLLTQTNAAFLAGAPLLRFREWVKRGQIKPFVQIDGQPFYHRSEVLALRRLTEALDGKRPSRPLPRTQEFF